MAKTWEGIQSRSQKILLVKNMWIIIPWLAEQWPSHSSTERPAPDLCECKALLWQTLSTFICCEELAAGPLSWRKYHLLSLKLNLLSFWDQESVFCTADSPVLTQYKPGMPPNKTVSVCATQSVPSSLRGVLCLYWSYLFHLQFCLSLLLFQKSSNTCPVFLGIHPHLAF